MPLFTYRCPNTGYLIQGFSAEDVAEDTRTYELVRCSLCNRMHRVNPATGAVLGYIEEKVASYQGPKV
jgi:hypothetical protein